MGQALVKRKGVGGWLLALLIITVLLMTLIIQGIIDVDPVAVAGTLMYVIATAVALYLPGCFSLRAEKAGTREIVCLLHPAGCCAFFWSAFEQKPTSFNLFAYDYTGPEGGGFDRPG